MKRPVRSIAVAALLATALAGCAFPGGSQTLAKPTSTVADQALADLAGQVFSKGPNGETAAPPSAADLTDAQVARIKNLKLKAAIVMHTGGDDWSQAQINGLKSEFGRLGIEVVATTDAKFDPKTQVSDLQTVMAKRPNIIVSLPTDPVATAAAYRAASQGGAKLVFMDNVPAGFKAGADYVSVVSADNYGNGVISAHLMARALGGKGKIGVVYHDEIGGAEKLQRARFVAIAGYSIETPRLLLNSQSARFPDGLANASGMVGRCLLVHTGEQVFARYDQRINQYKAPPGLALTEDFNRELPGADFIGGYTIECVGPHVGHYAAQMAVARGLWGARLRSAMLDYNHFAAFGLVGDVLPQRTNRVGLHATEVDGYGLPLPHIWFSHHENDHRLMHHAMAEMERIHIAAGGIDIWTSERTAHLMGGCRMGVNPADAVVDRDGQAFDVPNLFICDGSVFPSAGAGNPSLTIQAVAARTADRIVAMARRGELQAGAARVAA